MAINHIYIFIIRFLNTKRGVEFRPVNNWSLYLTYVYSVKLYQIKTKLPFLNTYTGYGNQLEAAPRSLIPPSRPLSNVSLDNHLSLVCRPSGRVHNTFTSTPCHSLLHFERSVFIYSNLLLDAIELCTGGKKLSVEPN